MKIDLNKKFNQISITLIKSNIKSDFIIGNNLFLSEYNLFGSKNIIKHKNILPKVDKFLTETSSFLANDYVVHIDHGIGIYKGLEAIKVNNAIFSI